MKNWQDYATDAATGQSKLKPNQLQNPQKTHPVPQRQSKASSKSPPKIWLWTNQLFTTLCVLALYYGISRTSTEHSGLVGLLRNTALCFYLPSLLVTALLTNDAIFGNTASPNTGLIFHWSYNILCLLLIVNFILAFIFERKYRKNHNQRWRTNLIFATIPMIFTLIAFLTRFL